MAGEIRPFANLLGSEKVFAQLERLLAKPYFPPLIFWGRAGVGKRTTALTFAQRLIGQNQPDNPRVAQDVAQLRHPDLKIIFPKPPRPKDGDEERYLENLSRLRPSYSLNQRRPKTPKTYLIPLEEVHSLISEMRFKPLSAPNRVVVIIDAERMLVETSNALLKTLEEPQADTRFILLTSRLSSLLPTIRSRSFPIYFPPLPDESIREYLLGLGYGEVFVQRALAFAYGSLRRALDFLDNPFPIPEEVLSSALSPSLPSLLDLIDELARFAFGQAGRQTDFGEIIENLILLLHSQLLNKVGLKNYEILYPEGFNFEEQISRIERLLSLQMDLEYHLNRRLFSFSLLTALLKKKSKP